MLDALVRGRFVGTDDGEMKGGRLEKESRFRGASASSRDSASEFRETHGPMECPLPAYCISDNYSIITNGFW
jgi:hypothetical protein